MTNRIRTALFWVHLAAGVVAGAAIITMSLTGTMLALQPQLLDWLEREQRVVPVPRDAQLLPPSVLLAAALTGWEPVDAPESITVTMSSEPGTAAVVSKGRRELVYVDPYTGTVLGHGAPAARRVFQWLTEFHRWFASPASWRASARAVTGWSTLAFVLLIVTGVVLWVPRSRNRAVWRRSVTPAWPSTAKARHFNWHTVVGFWCAPILLVLAITGVVLAFPWANRLVYLAAGSVPPQASARAAAPGDHDAPRGAFADRSHDVSRLDAGWTAARLQVPTWRSIALRIQPTVVGPVSITITDAAHWNRFARSQLTVSPAGTVLRWEPYDQQSQGQRWRGWARFAHTGELGGLAGQIVAGAASAGAVLLAWTGLSLAVRRFRRQSGAKQDVARAA